MEAANFELQGTDNQPLSFRQFWQRQPVVLTFLRHFGCAFCRDHLVELRDGYSQIRAAGGEVVGVTQGSPEQTRSFAARYNLPYPLLSDPSRMSYRGYGLVEGTLNQTVGPALFARKPAFMVKSFVQQEPITGNLRQLGGVFVIDQQGRIIYAHQAQPIYLYPSLDDLVGLIQAARGAKEES